MGGGANKGGKLFDPMKMLAFCISYRVADIFRIGVKISGWGKNSQGGVTIHQVGTSETANMLGPTLDTLKLTFLYTLILISHKLVYNGGLQTLNCRCSFRIQPMRPEYSVAWLQDLIYFRNKIWYH